MVERCYLGLFWLLALTGVALDQAAKYGVFSQLHAGGSADLHDPGARFWTLIPEKFELRAKLTNIHDDGAHILLRCATWAVSRCPASTRGLFLGWLGDSVVVSPEQANAFFAMISIVAALAIIIWSTHRATRHDRFLCMALGVILAGALGNLYDRVVFGGVRDFLHFHWDRFDLARLQSGRLLPGVRRFFAADPGVLQPTGPQPADRFQGRRRLGSRKVKAERTHSRIAAAASNALTDRLCHAE